MVTVVVTSKSCMIISFLLTEVLIFKSRRTSFRVDVRNLKGWWEKHIFYQTLGYANIMMVVYCFYRVKPTAVILCSYFPFSLLMCCDFNLIAFL